MIVTILGGSSQSTPFLLEYLSEQSRPERFRVRLAGRNSGRLAAVGRACRIIAPKIDTELYPHANWEKSLHGSHVVVVQVRIGGYEGRERDEARAVRFGSPGDEGLGLGGFSAAVRTWPKLRRILATVRRNAPTAIPLLLTSPLGLLIHLAALEWPEWRLNGICELPYTTLRSVCRATQSDPDEVTFGYTGVNHLGFLHNICARERDIVSAYGQMDEIPFADVVRRWRAVPLKYFSLHSQPGETLVRQAKSEQRARVLMRLQRAAMSAYMSRDVGGIRQALKARDAEWYREAIGPFLLALAGDRVQRPFFLTVHQRTETVQECAFQVDACGIHARPSVEGPAPVEDFIRSFIHYEHAAAHAIWHEDAHAMKLSLQMHSWMQDLDVDTFVEEVLAEEQAVEGKSETLCVS